MSDKMVAGWYPDPWGTSPLRWFDGRRWTTYVSAPGARLASPERTKNWILGLLIGGIVTVIVVFVIMAQVQQSRTDHDFDCVYSQNIGQASLNPGDC